MEDLRALDKPLVDQIWHGLEKLGDKLDQNAALAARAHDEIKEDVAQARIEVAGLSARVNGIEMGLERRYDFSKWLIAILISCAGWLRSSYEVVTRHHK